MARMGTEPNPNWGLTNHQNRKPDNELNRVQAGIDTDGK